MSNRLLFQHIHRSVPLRTFSTNVATNAKSVAPMERIKLRIAAAAIVERVPVVLPQVPQWEIDYLQFKEKREFIYDKEQQKVAQVRVDEELKLRAKKEKGKKKDEKKDKKVEKDGDGKDKEDVVKDEIIYPRITEADNKNNRKSLYRALEKRLYLIVKKPRQGHAWGFPQGSWEKSDGDHLRHTAERELKEECGTELNTFFIGNAPMGLYQYMIPKEQQAKFDNAQKTRLFFYKARYLRGPVRTNPKELVDHLWVTKDEMKEYLDADLYNYVKDILMD